MQWRLAALLRERSPAFIMDKTDRFRNFRRPSDGAHALPTHESWRDGTSDLHFEDQALPPARLLRTRFPNAVMALLYSGYSLMKAE